MKDNEIIKALECCVYIGENENCNKCKYNQEYLHGSSLLMNALGLINRQKAENERLKAEAGMTEGYAEALEQKARKEFAERLKDSFCYDWIYKGEKIKEDIDNLLKEMESESDV